MSKNEGFVWDSIINNPARHEEINRRSADENRRRAEREERLCQFNYATADRKRTRMEVQACRYVTSALAAGVVACLAAYGGLNWLAWILGIVAAGLALIASFGFGRISEIDRNKKRSTSRSNSSESSPQEQTYTDNVTAEMEETVR